MHLRRKVAKPSHEFQTLDGSAKQTYARAFTKQPEIQKLIVLASIVYYRVKFNNFKN